MLFNLQDAQNDHQLPETGMLLMGKLLLPGTSPMPQAGMRIDCIQKTAGKTPGAVTIS